MAATFNESEAGEALMLEIDSTQWDGMEMELPLKTGRGATLSTELCEISKRRYHGLTPTNTHPLISLVVYIMTEPGLRWKDISGHVEGSATPRSSLEHVWCDLSLNDHPLLAYQRSGGARR